VEPEVGIEPTTYRLKANVPPRSWCLPADTRNQRLSVVHDVHAAERLVCHEWCHALVHDLAHRVVHDVDHPAILQRVAGPVPTEATHTVELDGSPLASARIRTTFAPGHRTRWSSRGRQTLSM